MTNLILAAGDPLLFDVDFGSVWRTLLKVAIVFTLLLVSVMLMIWFERKLVSDMHNRIGPDVAGPWGILQTLADGIKLFFKEDLIPEKSDRFVFKLAPYLSLVPAFMTFSIVPIGGDFREGSDGAFSFFGEETFLQVADPSIGLLLFLALSSIAVYGVMLAGWSSGSKYPLLGSVRASAQMVSYEAALGLAAAAVLLQSGSLSTHDIVTDQAGYAWNLWRTGFIPFVIFFVAATAELNRPPFDLVEAEQELVGGFHTEYSSLRFALFFLAEFMNVITMSAVMVTLFFGGPAGPVLTETGAWAWGILWFFLKVMVFLFTYVWLRATLPRLRYDQLMDLGWKVLIPLALMWFVFLAGLDAVGRDWNVIAYVLISVAAMGLMGMLLMGAVRASKAQRLEEEVDVYG